MRANHACLAINAFVHSLAALAVTFSAVAVYCYYILLVIMMHSHRQSEFCPDLMYREFDRG